MTTRHAVFTTPYVDVLKCPLCRVEVHRTAHDDPRRGTNGLYDEIERACAEHLRLHHPLRYRLYRRTGWRWVVRLGRWRALVDRSVAT